MNDTKSKKIIFYGTQYCPDCMRAKAYLDSLDCEYEYINIAEDPSAAERVVEINKGFQSIPTIQLPDGTVLVEPSNEELSEALKELGRRNLIICHKQIKDN